MPLLRSVLAALLLAGFIGLAWAELGSTKQTSLGPSAKVSSKRHGYPSGLGP